MAHIYKDGRGKNRIQFTDSTGKRRDVKGFTTKRETEAEAVRLEEKALREKRGIFDHVSEAVALADEKPLWLVKKIDGVEAETGHIADWRDYLRSLQRGEEYVVQQCDRVRRVLCDILQYDQLSRVNAADVQLAIGKMMANKMSQQTASHYIQALKQFGWWLWKPAKRARGPLLDDLTKYTVTKLARPRDAFSEFEISAIVQAAERSEEYRFNMSGRDRAMAYLLAVITMLRRKELNSLRHASFNLAAANVTILSGSAKNKKEATLPLPKWLVEMLAPWLASKITGEPLLRLPKQTSRMLKRDAVSAKVDPARRDFHSLRHSGLTMIGNHATNPKVIQEFARHADIKTTMRYLHTTNQEKRATVEKSARALRPVRTGKDGLGQGKPNARSGAAKKRGIANGK